MAQLDWSEVQIREFVRARKLANPHLNAAMGIASPNDGVEESPIKSIG
jgi:hypothetical protein